MPDQLWLLIEEECDSRYPQRIFETAEAAKRWCALNIREFQKDIASVEWRSLKDVTGAVSYSWRSYTIEPVAFGEGN